MAARKGTRDKDNGEEYKRKFNTRDIILVLSALGVGGGGGVAGLFALSPEDAVFNDKVYLAYRDNVSPNEITVSSNDGLGAWAVQGPAKFVPSNALGDIKVDKLTGDVFVAFEATSNHASVVTLDPILSKWDYLGYPGFTEPLGRVTGIRMEAIDAGLYIIYDEDNLAPNGGSMLKFVP